MAHRSIVENECAEIQRYEQKLEALRKEGIALLEYTTSEFDASNIRPKGIPELDISLSATAQRLRQEAIEELDRTREQMAHENTRHDAIMALKQQMKKINNS